MCAPEGWRNFDASLTVRFERLPLLGKLYRKNASRFPRGVEYGDIVRGLPLAASSARAVFASHVLEHLALHDFRIALRHTLDLLEPNGIFRLIVPDLEQLARTYLEHADSRAASEFVEATGMGQQYRPRGLRGLVKAAFGNSLHLWMWDFKSLEQELMSAGFSDVRRAYFGDSQQPRFKDVEAAGRFVDAVGVECRRPG
jgi:hypothetical protein